MIAGFATVLAGCANPFWLPFLLPLLATISWRRLTRSAGITFAVGAGLTALGLLVAFSHGSSYWEPPLFDHPSLLVSLGLLPQRLQDTLIGTYFLTYATPAGPFASGLGLLWTVLTAFALLRTAWRAARGQAEVLEIGLAVSLIATLAITLIITPNLFGHRYLLPAITASALLLGLSISTMNRSVRIALGCLFLFSLPFVAVEFRHVSRLGYDLQDQQETTAAMDELLAYLDHQGIRHVYSIDPMLQWNIMFASRGQVTARWLDAVDRYPAFPLAVDCAVAHGERTALVGRISQLQPQARLSVPAFDDQFFAAPGLKLDDLAHLGFKINQCD